MKVITESFVWLKLSKITTVDFQVSLHQTKEVNNVTCFLFLCADEIIHKHS